MRKALSAALLMVVAAFAHAQSGVRLKSAVVVLSDDSELRREMEDAVVVTAMEHNYDAVASYTITPDVSDLDNRSFLRALENQGIRTVLMLRPAAVGAGSSLESVRDEVSPEMFQAMRDFAGEVSDTGPDDLIAVVHIGIYLLDGDRAMLLSAGAVWLDEEVESREVGVERLLVLLADRIDSVRPAIRDYLGLPPLQ